MTVVKFCNGCGHDKPLTEFYRDRAQKDGHTTRCKPCRRAATARWSQSNPERKAETWQHWYSQHRGQVTVRRRDYRAENPLCHRLTDGAIKASRLGCHVDEVAAGDLLSYWQSVGIAADRCYYTGEPLGDGWHLDHMTPLSRGGSHAVDNLVPCTPVANQAKGSQTAREYTSREALTA